jgi:hypothetical protein
VIFLSINDVDRKIEDNDCKQGMWIMALITGRDNK